MAVSGSTDLTFPIYSTFHYHTAMMLLDVVQHNWIRNRLVVTPFASQTVLRPFTSTSHAGAVWVVLKVGGMCSRAFTGVVCVQGMMLLQLYWRPYIWIRTPAIPFWIWATSTLIHFGQLVSRVDLWTRSRISAVAAAGGGGGLSAPQLSKERLLFEILWLGLGTCVSYLFTGGWAERQQLYQTTANLELMLLGIQNLKERTRRQLEVGLEPSIDIETLEGCRREVRVYIRGTHGYFPEVVEVAEAIYLELTEAMGLIKMAWEADTHRRLMRKVKEEEAGSMVGINPDIS